MRNHLAIVALIAAPVTGGLGQAPSRDNAHTLRFTRINGAPTIAHAIPGRRTPRPWPQLGLLIGSFAGIATCVSSATTCDGLGDSRASEMGSAALIGALGMGTMGALAAVAADPAWKPDTTSRGQRIAREIDHAVEVGSYLILIGGTAALLAEGWDALGGTAGWIIAGSATYGVVRGWGRR